MKTNAQRLWLLFYALVSIACLAMLPSAWLPAIGSDLFQDGTQYGEQTDTQSILLLPFVQHNTQQAPQRNTPLANLSFTAGNLVVYRVGDGSTSLANTGNPVFLDEYTPAGQLVQSLALPTVANATHKRLVANGSSATEGLVTRSQDGRYLLLTGYDATIPYSTSLSASSASAVNRVIGRVDMLGSIDTTTALRDAATGSNPRSATSSDGLTLWVTGGAGAVRTTSLGAITSTQLLTTPTNLRQLQIVAGQIYASTSSGSSLLGSVGNGLPTSAGQTFHPLPAFPTTGSPVGFLLVDLDLATAGVDTLYVADENEAALSKYSLVAGSWQANGIIGNAGDNYRGLTGVVEPANNGFTVTLYATRKGGSGASGGGELVKVVDSMGYNGLFTGTPTLLATAAISTAFRGIALAPVDPSLPTPTPTPYITPTATATATTVPTPTPFVPSNCPSDLLISEYVEGSGNNKAIELYNGSGAPISLSGVYSVQLYTNGSITPSTTINLSGTVAAGDVFIVAHTSITSSVAAQVDQSNGSLNFTGNDTIVLFKQGVMLDVFGQIGYDPSPEWGSGMVSSQDNTLIRKAFVTQGDANASDLFNPLLEWDGYEKDTLGFLGSHTIQCMQNGATATPTLSPTATPLISATVTLSATTATPIATQTATKTAAATPTPPPASTPTATVAATPAATATNPPIGSCPSDLLISEYVEGSSNNKAIELYNGSGSVVTLTGHYSVQLYTNGAISPSTTIQLSGTIAAGEVFVLAHSSITSTVAAQVDQSNGSLNFTGNDAVALLKQGTLLDVIGQIGQDPGTEWGSNLTSTQDNSLVRKAFVTKGDANGTDAFDPALEWDGYAKDSLGFLGNHAIQCLNHPVTSTPAATNTALPSATFPGATATSTPQSSTATPTRATATPTGTSNGTPVATATLQATATLTATQTLDQDSDTLLDSLECPPAAACPDSDQDGKPNPRDIDSDGDGIPDLIEANGTLSATTEVEAQSIEAQSSLDSPSSVEITPINSDDDALPDYLDSDSDNDSLPDRLEAYDRNHDGQADLPPTGKDGDNDGLDDAYDRITSGQGAENAAGANLTAQNADGDGLADWRDADDDGDTIPTRLEISLLSNDPDADGIPNHLDTDSDGDGVSDQVEAGTSPTTPLDENHNNIPDFLESGNLSNRVYLPSVMR